MALFQKKPLVTSSPPLYTLGLQKTLVIVGLGNVGKEYDSTRHNIGFTCLDALAAKLDFPDFIEKKDLKCHFSMTTISDCRVILVKPTTFMNKSGEAVRAVTDFYKLRNDQIVVVHDELDIPFGQIRLRTGGSSAGNNGLKSLIEHLGEDFGRVRIGIRNDVAEKADSANFVLGKFDKSEQEQLPNLMRETTSILSELIHGARLNPETRSFLV